MSQSDPAALVRNAEGFAFPISKGASEDSLRACRDLLPGLMQALGDTKPQVQQAAGEALAGLEGAVPPMTLVAGLLDCLQDPVDTHRQALGLISQVHSSNRWPPLPCALPVPGQGDLSHAVMTATADDSSVIVL